MSLRGKKILITYGPTYVPIDGVRVISNISTGELGRLLVNGLRKKGAGLTVLEGPVRRPLDMPAVRVRPFVYFDELRRLMKEELRKDYDVCIHAAAVSDYRVRNPAARKLPSGRRQQLLRLTATPKIIRSIKKTSPHLFLVGFKLGSPGTSVLLKKEALTLIRQSRCDWVVANTVGPGARYRAFIVNAEGKILARAGSRKKVSQKIIELLDKKP